jgi:hypothetical protein
VLEGVRNRRKNAAWGKFVWSLVAVAAAVVAAAVPAWWLLNTGSNRGDIPDSAATSVAQDGPASPETRPTPAPAAPVRPGTVDAGQTHDPLPPPDTPPGDPSPVLPGESSVVMQRSPSPGNASREGLFREGIIPWEIAANFPGVNEQRAEMIQSVWNERVATPLKPVTSSVTGAVNVLRRTLVVEPALPGSTEEQKPQAGVTDGVRAKELA